MRRIAPVSPASRARSASFSAFNRSVSSNAPTSDDHPAHGGSTAEVYHAPTGGTPIPGHRHRCLEVMYTPTPATSSRRKATTPTGTAQAGMPPSSTGGTTGTRGIGVAVGPAVGLGVGVSVGVANGTDVGVAVGAGGTGVAVGVAVGTGVGVAVGVGAWTGAGLGVGVGTMGPGPIVGVGVGCRRRGPAVGVGVRLRCRRRRGRRRRCGRDNPDRHLRRSADRVIGPGRRLSAFP